MSILIKVEVAKKQAYIFASKELKNNVTRSNHIAYVTGSEFFKCVAQDKYNEEENLVYSGGGHAVLRYETREAATEFVKLITTNVMECYSGLELFCQQMEYDETRTPQENLQQLSMKLEQKKSFRKNVFGNISFGIEKLDAKTFKVDDSVEMKELEFKLFSDITFPRSFTDIVQQENFLSVVHIDGNAMGIRIGKIYENAEQNNDDFSVLAKKLRRFSECIQHDFETAFRKMYDRIPKEYPIRPLILAGDDVCFITKGSVGLECARIFIEELIQLVNEQDGESYSACAGVAMVHTKFPFYKAYQLSEELCSNAKKLGVSYYQNGSVSSIDWHIEYGQLKTHFSEIRQDYICDDGNVMTLRPMVLKDPNAESKIPRERSYVYFKNLCTSLQGKVNDVNHGKLKQLREPLKQGELETSYFVVKNDMKEIVYDVIRANYGDKAVEEMIRNLELIGNTTIFRQFADEKRCSCFDAIEMIDLYVEVKGDKHEC